MRNMLFNSEKSIMPLESEISIIRDYVALENINREQFVQFHVHKEFSTFYKLSEVNIPTNVLQPLIENAFIHGFTDYLNRSLFIQININISYNNLNIDIIDNGVEFINTHKNINKQNVFVHCYWGLMRSATVIAGYLIKYENYSVDNAIELIKNKRSYTFSNLYNFRDYNQ